MERQLKEYYESQDQFKSFAGRGGRIDGKKKGTKGVKHQVDLTQCYQRGVPNYNWSGQTLTFIRNGPIKGNKKKFKN